MKASIQSSLQELKTGQTLLSKDLNQKVKAVELALARGCNILDAVMTRKHERETEVCLCLCAFISTHYIRICTYIFMHAFMYVSCFGCRYDPQARVRN